MGGANLCGELSPVFSISQGPLNDRGSSNDRALTSNVELRKSRRSMTGAPEEIDQRLIRALAHPVRIRILQILGERVTSPNAMSKELGAPLGTVSYHTRVLLENDCIEEVKNEPRRGALEHFYRAKPDSGIGSKDWRKVPPSLQEDFLAASFNAFFSRAVAALTAGSLKRREGSGITWKPITVDERGWNEVRKILDETTKKFGVVAEKSKRRLGKEDGTALVVAIGAFEADSEPRNEE